MVAGLVEAAGFYAFYFPSLAPLADFIATGFAYRNTDEIPPVPPALRAVETPLPHLRPGDEQRPGRAGDIHSVKFHPVRLFRTAENDAPGVAEFYQSAGQVFAVSTPQDDRAAPPRMIMQGAVIIGAQELVQVNVEEAVAGDDPPAEQIRIFGQADDEIRLPAENARYPW